MTTPPTPAALPPSQRLHLILLGVADVAASVRFYQALGWQQAATSNDGFAKFDLGGYALCLLSRAAFAADARSPTASGSGFAGIGLVYLARTPDEVAQVLARAVAAGGTLVKPATRTDWGVAGYFKDPDGHLFEVDYEDGWVLDHDHRLHVDGIRP
ncbi:glyoxalase [Pseudoduganella sp. FT93W]|uniref:Glyoxalase n=1 Tax=Duganella fentianensis TaxID=2692177 RepID=A0A845I0J6_9BURK|nr:VOC family protein [Duganella fentianensis]MYN45325.1 glyoxalase [Duganella fentianensis]